VATVGCGLQLRVRVAARGSERAFLARGGRVYRVCTCEDHVHISGSLLDCFAPHATSASKHATLRVEAPEQAHTSPWPRLGPQP
jgi:hypothetical protein